MKTTTQFAPIAVLISAPRTAHILGMLDPTIEELDYYTDLHDHYVVFDFPTNGKYLIMTREAFDQSFEEEQSTWFFQPVIASPR